MIKQKASRTKTKAKPTASDEDGSTPDERFERLAKALIAVPKSGIDKREAEYQRKKAAKKRRVT